MRLEDQQFTFIIGAPRSGTTMLQVLLAQHAKIATTVELTLFNQYLRPWFERWQAEVETNARQGRVRGLPAVWGEEDFLAFAREFLARAYARLLERQPGRTHFLDKNPNYSLCVPLIKRLLPQARFIHLLRDGRDVAASLVAATEMGFGIERHVEGAALWRRYVEAARGAASLGAADYLEVRYETFLQDAPAEFARLLRFCGLEADQAWIEGTLRDNTFAKMKNRRAAADPRAQAMAVHYRKGQAGGWREEFTAADRSAIEYVAGDLLRELGYADAEWNAAAGAGRWRGQLGQEIKRRRQVAGLALALARVLSVGGRLPKGFEVFGL